MVPHFESGSVAVKKLPILPGVEENAAIYPSALHAPLTKTLQISEVFPETRVFCPCFAHLFQKC